MSKKSSQKPYAATDAYVARHGWHDAARWRAVQAEFAGVEGPEGVQLRQRHYAPFFQRFGRDVRIDAGCFFSSPWRIVLSDGVRLNREAIFEGSSAIWIGRNTRIGQRFFVHSANHAINADADRPFHERGFDWQPVRIGDNVLISANVSVMPGASLGNGCFVAAGAVVTAKTFADDSHLYGLPATPRPTGDRAGDAVDIEPALGLVVRTLDSAAGDAARQLLTVLALPQVGIFEAGSAIPGSVGAVILMEEGIESPRPPDATWRISAEDTRVQQPASPGDNLRIGKAIVPTTRRYRVAQNGFGTRPTLTNAARTAFFIATNAALKGATVSDDGVDLQWGLMLVAALESSAGATRQRWSGLVGTIAELIGPDVAGGNWTDRRKACGRLASEAVAAVVGEFPGLKAMLSGKSPEITFDVRRAFLQRPWLVPYLVLKLRKTNPAFCSALLDALEPHMNNSSRKAALGISHLLLGRRDAADAIVASLLDEDWYLPHSSVPRNLLDNTSINRQPMLAALLLWQLALAEPDAPLTLPAPDFPLADWRVFGEPGKRLSLVSPARRQVSPSLLENWLTLQEAPFIPEGHILLDNNHYRGVGRGLEQLWLDVFRTIFSRLKQPMLRLRPWPAGYDYALSIRYDVDRPVAAEGVRNILRIQKQRLNASCASWYFIAGAPHNQRVQGVLLGWNQEYGHHSCLVAEEQPTGLGVTAHSASTSEYWRGEATVDSLAAAGARYGEAMVGLHDVARPGWSRGRQSPVWVTPLHFPLEGSTTDTDLTYFTQRKPFLDEQVRAGGHVIIGSHPDCEQRLMDEALAALPLSRAWSATVGDAVERVRWIAGHGNVRASVEPDGDVLLCSRRTLADVAFDVTFPDGRTVTRAASLQAGRTRRVPAQPEAPPGDED
jgi:acetyltransferase-like isoleucine patch superfamily enzyme